MSIFGANDTPVLDQVRIRLPTLALKPRGDAIKSPNQGYQWPHKKGKILLKILGIRFYIVQPGFELTYLSWT